MQLINYITFLANWRTLLVITIVLGIVSYWLLKFIFHKQFRDNVVTHIKKLEGENLQLFLKYWKRPILTSSLIIALCLLLPLTIKRLDVYSHTITILTVSILTWFAIQTIRTIRDIVIRNGFRTRPNLDAQRINTQVGILVRIATIAIIVIGVSLALMTFPAIKEIGVSILASAGVAGVIFGFAAQKSLGNIFAGIQIALTQPIKIGDEVVIEHETGKIEEIYLTYVVMCTMDKRRFIIPINYFVQNIVQNWTMNSAELWGIVYLEVDYTAPIQKIREAFLQLINECEWWDRKYQSFEVTNAKSQTIELRAVGSAVSSADAGNLRSYIREKLIEFLQVNYPGCLPKIRLEFKDQSEKERIRH